MAVTDRTWEKRYQLDRAQGVPRSFVPAAPLLAHLERLSEVTAVSMTTLADIAGVSPDVVSKWHRGTRHTARRATAARIRALTPEAVLAAAPALGLVPRVGTTRRIRALLAIGWRHQDITAAMGTGRPSGVVLNQRGDLVKRCTHDAVVRAYDALWARPGPSDLTRRRAAASGYAPPLAWDEDTIDDPTAAPQTHAPDVDADVDEIAVARAIAGDHTGTLTRSERAQVIAHLAARGYSDAEIAAHCHVTDRTVERDRRAHNIPSTWKADAA